MNFSLGNIVSFMICWLVTVNEFIKTYGVSSLSFLWLVPYYTVLFCIVLFVVYLFSLPSFLTLIHRPKQTGLLVVLINYFLYHTTYLFHGTISIVIVYIYITKKKQQGSSLLLKRQWSKFTKTFEFYTTISWNTFVYK